MLLWGGGMTVTACAPQPVRPQASEEVLTTPFPSATATATPLPAIAIVNGEPISLAEYQAEIARYQAAQAALGREVSAEEAGRIVLDDLINQTLLSQAARAAGLALSAADLQARIESLAASLGGMDALRAWQAAHGYDEASFRSALKRAVEAARMRDRILAGVPEEMEQVHARQIVFKTESEAQAVLAQLRSGARFDDLAARYDPLTRGDLGWFPPGYLLDASLDSAVFALQPGQFSEVISSTVGYHILYVVERGQRRLSPDALLTLQERALNEWIIFQRTQATILFP